MKEEEVSFKTFIFLKSNKSYISYINIKTFKGLRPFVRRVVDMRTEAKKSGDEAKSLTAKLFGNSSYGKCGESIAKYRNTVITSDKEKLYKLVR